MAAALAVLVCVGLLVGGGAGLTVTALALLVTGSVWGVVLLARLGLERVALVCLVAAAATAPWNAVRPTAAITLSDVFLAAMASLVALHTLRRGHLPHLRPPAPTVLLGGVAVLAGGLLGTLVGGQQRVASLVNVGRFGAAAIGTVLVIAVLSPSTLVVRRAMLAWLLGAVVSVIAGAEPGNRVAGRSLGLTTHPNHFGLVSALSAPVALALALSTRGWRRVGYLALFLALSYGVAASGSRAAVVGYVVALVVVLWLIGSAGAFLASTAAVTLAGLLLLAGVVHLPQETSLARLVDQQATQGSDEGREEGLSATLATVEAYPFTGIGFEQAKQGHNVYLQIWASSGIVGLAGFLVAMVSVLRRSRSAVRLLRRDGDRGASYLVAGMLAGLSGFLTASFFQNVVWDRYLWLFVALLTVLAGTSGLPEPAEPVVRESGAVTSPRRRPVGSAATSIDR